MSFNVKDIKFPTYKGLESQYEHVIYTYLDEVLGSRGYSVKIKKTEYDNVDKALCSSSGQKSCDAYIFNNKSKDMGHNLLAFFELESNLPTSKLKDGIEQVKSYCKLLTEKYKSKYFKTENNIIFAIVYDGIDLCMWKYNIATEEIINIIGSSCECKGVSMFDKENRYKFLDQFPAIEKKKDENSETTIINKIKTNIRNTGDDIKKNKSFLMTLLAAIYAKTKSEDFENAIDMLNQGNTHEENGIYKEWKDFKVIIKYDNDVEVKNKIKNVLYKDAKSLWELSQDKNIDLYGFIYEELAEKATKKTEGEYYTSRHIIAPIVSSVLQKHLFPLWKINNPDSLKLAEILCQKKIVDPFCGSGGFLYEYLRYFKNFYNINDINLNNIAQKSLFGFDRNGTMAAFLNLYLIGDGKTNLYKVTSSINWQNMWKYEEKEDKIKLYENNADLEKQINANKDTIRSFINCLFDWNKIKEDFAIEVTELNYEKFEQLICAKKSMENFLYGLKDYKEDFDCVLRYFYNNLLEISTNEQRCPSFKNFVNSLGVVDWVLTNVPYGEVGDKRMSSKNKGTLASLSIRECIDLLRPSTERLYNENGEEDPNGTEKRSNYDGGIATIVVPNGIFQSEDENDIRDYIFERCNVLSVIKLPEKAFAPYATIQTFIITIQKKAPFEFCSSKQSGRNTFFYISDNDGKANSDNRYATTLIGELPIVVNNEITTINEYLHDDFAINIEQYPEGNYLSKIERAWINGHEFKDSTVWNQKRFSNEWNGTEWSPINDTKLKWTFKPLEEKLFEKRVEKTNNIAKNIMEMIIVEEKDKLEDFMQLDISEQRQIIVKKAKRALLNGIESISCQEQGEKLKINIKGVFKNKSTIQNIIRKHYKDISILNNDLIYVVDMMKMIALFEQYNISEFPKYILDLSNFLDGIEEIRIVEEKAFFYAVESYKQYYLVPEYYLEPNDDFMSMDKIIENILRLRNMLKG